MNDDDDERKQSGGVILTLVACSRTFVLLRDTSEVEVKISCPLFNPSNYNL